MSQAQNIKRAVLSREIKDDSVFLVGQGTYNSKVGDVDIVFPYGLYANPPVGSMLLMFNVMGQEENRAALAYYQKERYENEPGEVTIGSPMFGSFIKFNKDEGIDIDCKGDLNLISNLNIKITSVDGNITIYAPNGQVTVHDIDG